MSLNIPSRKKPGCPEEPLRRERSDRSLVVVVHGEAVGVEAVVLHIRGPGIDLGVGVVAVPAFVLAIVAIAIRVVV